MSHVFWRRNKPDPTGDVWHDLQDPTVKGWVVTYRESGDKWLVMYRDNYRSMNYNPDLADRYIAKADISEEQLRNDLRLHYILTRGET
jgi:hypothetical protein